MTHYVIAANGHPSGTCLYLSERRAARYQGRPRREPVLLEDAQVFAQRGAATTSLHRASKYLPHMSLQVVPVRVSV